MIPEVLSLYSGAPLAVRAHVWGRWFSCPFVKVAGAVPGKARVLEVGCGYGLFSCHLALTGQERQVTGIDVDVKKVVHGQYAGRQASARGARCEFHLAPPGEIPDGPWDAIVIVDVLYLLDPDAQAGLLHTCAERLALGGVLVVKEMARQPRWKATWNQVQETLAVKVARITAGEQLSFLEPASLAAWMQDDGLSVIHHPVDKGYPHPHHLFLARRRGPVPSPA